MKRIWLCSLVILVFFLSVLASSASGGHLVTAEIKLWAKKAVDDERSLQLPTKPNSVAVLYFFNRTAQPDLDPLQKGIALMLITDLSKIEEIQVVERVRLQALVEELGLGVSGLVQSDTAPRVGRLLGTQWLIGGTLEGQESLLHVTSAPLDVPSQTILGQPTVSGQLTELFQMEKKLLFDIINLLKIKLTSEKEKELRKPCTNNVKAFIALSAGIDESDRGNYKKAAQMYKKALDMDPDICVAGEALNELDMMGQVPKRKGTSGLLRSLRDRTSLTDQLVPEEPLKRAITPKDVSPIVVNPPIRCGDGICNGTETCGTCPADCGVCPPRCGDGTCNGEETCLTCPADCPGSCCGNGICEEGEDFFNCPADCLG